MEKKEKKKKKVTCCTLYTYIIHFISIDGFLDVLILLFGFSESELKLFILIELDNN